MLLVTIGMVSVAGASFAEEFGRRQALLVFSMSLPFMEIVSRSRQPLQRFQW
ncbi:MAG: hypothetical protein ABI356_07770 [Steroidobacteraceae bacterium]